MQVMVLDKSTHRVDRCLVGFLEAGLRVMGSGSVAVADTCIKRASVDLLIITAEAAGAGTRTLIHAAETRNPNVATILLAADVARASEIAAKSLPSVHCVLSADCAPEQVLRFGLASLQPEPKAEFSSFDQAMAEQEEPVEPAMPDEAGPAPEEAPVFSSKRRDRTLAPTAYAA